MEVLVKLNVLGIQKLFVLNHLFIGSMDQLH